MNKKILICLGLLLLAAGISRRMFVGDSFYCRNYYKIVNKAGNDLSYESVMRANAGLFTKTKVISKEKELIQLEDGRTFVYYIYPSGLREFRSVEITDSRYRFGIKKIGLWTKKKSIQKTFEHERFKLKEYRSYIQVEDGDAAVYFYFDSDDFVKKIVIGIPD